MPYFKNDNINILLIHIPKTGGTSLETYFLEKYQIPLDASSVYTLLPLDQEILHSGVPLHDYVLKVLYLHLAEYTKANNLDINSSLQHLTYQSIMKYKVFFGIDTTNLTVLSAVRNPYTRIISDLFYYNLIDTPTTCEEVFTIISKCLAASDGTYDNHFNPQYTFVTDEKGALIDGLHLMKLETLNEDMKALGYDDFNITMKKNTQGITDYYAYLNSDSIRLINAFYAKDFELFGYEKRPA